MVIDGNNDYVTKSKLTITLKPLNKYNERSKIDILKTVAQNRLTVNIQRERVKDTHMEKPPFN